jgi:uncharacterized protein DUF4375
MSDKVACTACGAMILVATAESNGGLCLPCKRGYRDRIEEGKLRYAERKLAEANPDPAAKHWRWLVNEVTSGAFVHLSAENQLYFAAVLLEGEVYNGGLQQFFTNSSGDYHAYAVRGLEEMGAAECLRILLAAKQVLFGARDVPDDRFSRIDHMQRMGSARARELDEFNRQFGKEAATFHKLAAQYARKHELYPDDGS